MIKTVEVKKVYKGGTHAVDNISMEIEKGEFVFIVGPSGSGKSTFIKMLNKEEEPTDGSIYVAGKNLANLPRWRVPYLRRNVGCVFQDFKLLPNKTVFENVAFALEVIGRPRTVVRRQVPQILDLVGLGEKLDRFPDELSGGEQQRVSIARAFVNRPLILLADEPTGNLDPATGQGVLELLRDLNRDRDLTMILVTHDTQIAGQADRTVRLAEGRIEDWAPVLA